MPVRPAAYSRATATAVAAADISMQSFSQQPGQYAAEVHSTIKLNPRHWLNMHYISHTYIYNKKREGKLLESL